ncbi:MAG TPA: glycosyltransferase family 2 protein [Mycobacteriales bacterium]|nr:glycosyltransferase family 2 protein [Mycobacteriales bacterium]
MARGVSVPGTPLGTLVGPLVGPLVGGVVAALTAHAAVNARLLRVPLGDPPPTVERVSVLLPVRDEASRVLPCLAAIRAQRGLPDLEVLVLDDGSADGTGDLVRRVARDDPRVRLLTAPPPPPGWLGKPHACARLAERATGTVLAYVDADVVLAPHAVAATVALLRRHGLALVSPYPRQQAETWSERLLQPLLQWSWLTFLPLRLAERSARPSLAAANGQLLAVDTAAYRAAGGHGAVRSRVVEDVALLRTLKRHGFRGTVADGTHLARCRMYAGWPEVRDGYTKSLHVAFGPPPAAAATIGALAALYVLPPLAALRGSRAGLLGYLAGAAGRVVTARRTGGRVLPDALAHPLSVALLGYLTALSHVRRRRGTLRWKGRVI